MHLAAVPAIAVVLGAAAANPAAAQAGSGVRPRTAAGERHKARPSDHDLTLVVEGVRNTRGVIGVLVFHSPAGWPEHVASAFTSAAVPAQTPVTVLTIHALPEGEYAVVVLHDENSNMRLDRNALGQPKEQWGMSNNPHVFLSAPSFESARFPFFQDEHLHIRLR